MDTFPWNIDLMSPKLRKWDQKTKKNRAQNFPFFQFSFVAILSHWYKDWVKVALDVLKHAEMQSENNRGVQSFGAKSGGSGPPAQQF